MQYIANSEQQTKKIAKQLARTLVGGDIVLLEGDLGAGKTTFVKGLAEELEISEDITSPTFSLLNIYNIQYPIFPPKADPPLADNIHQLIHIDTYRLKDEQELIDIGVEDYLGDPQTVTVIEWPEKILNLLKDKKTIKVSIETTTENFREIIISNSNIEIRNNIE